MLWRVSGLGFELVAAVVGFGLIGWFTDRWQGTAPRFTLIGLGLGVVGGGYNFVRSALVMSRAAAAEYESMRRESAETDGDGGAGGGVRPGDLSTDVTPDVPAEEGPDVREPDDFDKW